MIKNRILVIYLNNQSIYICGNFITFDISPVSLGMGGSKNLLIVAWYYLGTTSRVRRHRFNNSSLSIASTRSTCLMKFWSMYKASTCFTHIITITKINKITTIK
ncbi:hypothetical protein BDA99DRAFT_311623 [Phascolomyces articulosus]|uniref:Uncharacterized protein n=1 Tax=Phascolomyces articulosus TaxID=60185 RepID=A0AAD5P7I7_9FUNG|nr:hypothetical protein BDA99DRAFT_311623 [Phascolomyces articulosus]